MLCTNISNYRDKKSNTHVNCFAGYSRGYEKIWVVADNFGFNTYEEFFKNRKEEDGTTHKSYTFDQFEVRGYFSNKQSLNGNILSRIRNNIVHALNEHTILPKLIVIVPDDDIITEKDFSCMDINIGYRRIIRYLAKEIIKAIDIYKDYLPNKSKRFSIPHTLWIAPPTHKNFTTENNDHRRRFADSLEQVISELTNMSVLRMVKVWDQDDSKNFVYETYRFTSLGLTRYWQSVDAAIRYWTVVVTQKLAKNQNKSSKNKSFRPNQWKHSDQNGQKTHYRRLATPP